MDPPGVKPEEARLKKNALRLLEVPTHVVNILYDKAMDPKFTCKIPGHDCVFSTRTPSQERGQLKVEHKGVTYQMLAVHAVALHQGKMPTRWYDELSHLDGCGRCLVCTHWELPWENISRDGCLIYGHFEKCPHDPPCKKMLPLDLVEAAIKQKQDEEEKKIQNDPKKKRKREQNAKQYAKKKARKD